MNVLRYSRVAVVLHWAVAMFIVTNVALALVADHVPDDWVRPVINAHKSIGITVLGLVILRVLWRVSHRPPALPSAYARWERLASHTAHGLLYVLMLILPLSGWLHDSAWKDATTHPMFLFGWFEWPRIGYVMSLGPETRETLHTLFGDAHTAFAYCLYALVALHVLGALKHQWIDGEAELQRMSI